MRERIHAELSLTVEELLDVRAERIDVVVVRDDVVRLPYRVRREELDSAPLPQFTLVAVSERGPLVVVFGRLSSVLSLEADVGERPNAHSRTRPEHLFDRDSLLGRANAADGDVWARGVVDGFSHLADEVVLSVFLLLLGGPLAKVVVVARRTVEHLLELRANEIGYLEGGDVLVVLFCDDVRDRGLTSASESNEDEHVTLFVLPLDNLLFLLDADGHVACRVYLHRLSLCG